MQILPAIDLLDGQCVRLKQGAESTAKIYSKHPQEIAELWQENGASIIHVVNLDGAFGRSQKNDKTIRKILKRITIPIELGGGIRSFEDACLWLDSGVSRIIFGTLALKNPEIVKQTIEKYSPSRVIVGIDGKKNRVAVEGWEKQTDIAILDLAFKMKDMGVERIIYTDISRDGELIGPNIDRTKTLAEKSGLKIIASGGFSKYIHFDELLATGKTNIEGAIVGTALYEKQLNLSDLIEQYEKRMGN